MNSSTHTMEGTGVKHLLLFAEIMSTRTRDSLPKANRKHRKSCRNHGKLSFDVMKIESAATHEGRMGKMFVLQTVVCPALSLILRVFLSRFLSFKSN